jgi:hypothetical protein
VGELPLLGRHFDWDGSRPAIAPCAVQLHDSAAARPDVVPRDIEKNVPPFREREAAEARGEQDGRDGEDVRGLLGVEGCEQAGESDGSLM